MIWKIEVIGHVTTCTHKSGLAVVYKQPQYEPYAEVWIGSELRSSGPCATMGVAKAWAEAVLEKHNK